MYVTHQFVIFVSLIFCIYSDAASVQTCKNECGRSNGKDDMESFFTDIVDSYESLAELKEFAVLYSLEKEPYVKQKIFQLQCRELLELVEQDAPIPSPESSEEQTLYVNKPSNESSVLNKDSRSHSNSNSNGNSNNRSGINEPSQSNYFRPWENIRAPSPQPGPSGINQMGSGKVDKVPYIFRKRNEKIFAKTKAKDTEYEVRLDESWRGNKFVDLYDRLHNMFDTILDEVRENGSDLGRVVISNNGLKSPIVIPLQKWENLNADTVMDGVTKVLNSNEELVVDDNISVSIGSIAIPKGSGGGIPITSLFGPNNSIIKKRAMFYVYEDEMCLPIAIGLCFLKSCTKVYAQEWSQLTAKDMNLSEMEKAIKYRTCSWSYYCQLKGKGRGNSRKEMALTLSRIANVTAKKTMGINDISSFEKALDVNVNVISSQLGNRFIRVTDNPDVTNLFIYLVESDNIEHFHGIASIAGFFGSSYFCVSCLKPYKNRGTHSCETTCYTCGSNECTMKEPMACLSCSRQCRSMECFLRHKQPHITKTATYPSQCDTWYQCRSCKKVMKYEDRDRTQHECGEWKCRTCQIYYVGQHFCYHRSNVNEASRKKFLFYDFETRQDDRMQCDRGYKVTKNKCTKCCSEASPCNNCRLCQNCHESKCGLYQHVVNFAVLQSSCECCHQEDLEPKSKCINCGNRCDACSKKDKFGKYECKPCSNTCGFREHIFRGDDTIRQFCTHIMQTHYKDSILVAHNAKAFDLYPILEVLINRHAVRPDKIIYSGTKIMYMHIAKALNLTFVDSLNFIPMKLADIPKAFDIKELCKGFFPHYFNTKENWEYTGPYPGPQYYGSDYMPSSERCRFMTWHESKINETFDFQQEMLTYCRSDVDILRRGCLKFREVMMKATKGVDPFDYVTIAGACMGIFKTLFLNEQNETEVTNTNTDEIAWYPERFVDGERYISYDNHWLSISKLDNHLKIGRTRFVKSPIAMVPPEGYTKRDNYSKASIQWLEWIMIRNGLQIRHALNEGEFRIPETNFRADGYDETSKTIYEYLGCVYHGCPKCYPYDRTTTTHPTTDQSMEELYVVTKKREAKIKSLEYKYVSIWEHEFLQQLKANEDMKALIENLDIQNRLNPRDSFFGGRTNAIRLHYKIQQTNETIEYYDFTSLYPWTNKYCRYPVGHPQIITDHFRDMSSYFGIAKVKILAPGRLFHPVLPYTSNGKLKFPLCRTCADKEDRNPCSCKEEQRAFIGTWCTPEIMKALEHGYKILKTYEVYHFEESMIYNQTMGEEGLFSKYVNTFLKIKQEASGWPENCETEEQKWEYIRKYEEREGITLDYDKIEVNPGLRSFAKLCLNSFWGKFGQRLGLKQSRFLHESEADIFFQMLSDPKKDIHDFHILTPEMLQLEWSDDPQFLPLDTKTNVFLASFTTAWARLKLYSVLEEVGEDCLYMDTDSVIFIDRSHEHTKRLPVGNYLGELTNEISSKQKYIVEYVSGGPKNYAFRTYDGSETCKVRGFTLNYTNSKLINFDAVKDLVIHSQENPNNKNTHAPVEINNRQKRKLENEQTIIITNPRKISRDAKKMVLFNRKEDKRYKIVYTKRVVLPDLKTIPYGY